MRIKAIGPNSARSLPPGYGEAREELFKKYVSPGTEVSVGFTDAPPGLGGYAGMRAGCVTEANTETLAPFMAKAAIQAEKEGFDAIFLTGQLNVGAGVAKHVVNIPVIDSAPATLHVAALVGDRICVLMPWKSTNSHFRRLVKRWGMSEFVTSIKSWDMSPFESSKEEARERTLSLCKTAVEEEDAQVIAPLCGPWIPLLFSAKEIEAEVGVPVLDSWWVGLRVTEMFVNLKLSASQKAYPYTELDLSGL